MMGVSRILRRAACRYNYVELQEYKPFICLFKLHEVGLVAKGTCVYLSKVAAV